MATCTIPELYRMLEITDIWVGPKGGGRVCERLGAYHEVRLSRRA
jgi:hypothetical protein